MRFFKTGSFEGIPQHRMQGTKVMLAGRTATSRRLRYHRSIIRRNALKRYGRHSVSGDGKVRKVMVK